MDYFNYSYIYNFLKSLGFLRLLIAFFVVIAILLFIIAEWKLFKKAGKRGWESLIPFYSSWVLTKIAGLNWWWFLFLIIDFTFKMNFDNISISFNVFSFIGYFNCFYNLAKKFGYNRSTAIVAGIFPYIFVLIFAFSKDCIYNVDYPVNVNGIFGDDGFNNITEE